MTEKHVTHHFCLTADGDLLLMNGDASEKLQELTISKNPNGTVVVKYSKITSECDINAELEAKGIGENTVEIKTVVLYPKVFLPKYMESVEKKDNATVKLDQEAATKLADSIPEAKPFMMAGNFAPEAMSKA